MQGPSGPGSLEIGRRHEPPLPEPEGILRRGEGREKAVAAAADAGPSVNVLVRAQPVVHYTIKTTVNDHPRYSVRLSG